jgi:hypothetical protein
LRVTLVCGKSCGRIPIALCELKIAGIAGMAAKNGELVAAGEITIMIATTGGSVTVMATAGAIGTTAAD